MMFSVPFGVSLVLLFFLSRAIYRLWFSPLSHIPGPKIAGNVILLMVNHQLNVRNSPDFLVLCLS